MSVARPYKKSVTVEQGTVLVTNHCSQTLNWEGSLAIEGPTL